MKMNSIFSLGLISLLTTSATYAADKYPLDPAYAANKKAMADATKYEEANLPSSSPSSGGEQWKLIYSGNPVSSVNIPTGIKFISIDYGTAGQKVLAISPSTPHGEIDAVYGYGQSCRQGAGHGEQICTEGVMKQAYISWDGKSIKSYVLTQYSSLQSKSIRVVYVM